MKDQAFESQIRHSTVTNFVTNTLINGAFGWLVFRGSGELQAWSGNAYGPDLALTGFLLSAIMVAILMEVARRKARRGESAEIPAGWGPFLAALPKNRWVIVLAAGIAGGTLGVVSVLVASLVASSLTVLAYSAFKGLWAGALAASLVAPATVVGLQRGRLEGESAQALGS